MKDALGAGGDLNDAAPSILVAATRSPTGPDITYSAFKRKSRFRPLALTKIPLVGRIQQCDTFNGNFVLIPGGFFESVGGLDPAYVHMYGDIDLGYLAARRGVKSYLATQAIGSCEGNVVSAKKRQESLRQRTHFIYKNGPRFAALPLVALSMIRALLGRKPKIW